MCVTMVALNFRYRRTDAFGDIFRVLPDAGADAHAANKRERSAHLAGVFLSVGKPTSSFDDESPFGAFYRNDYGSAMKTGVDGAP